MAEGTQGRDPPSSPKADETKAPAEAAKLKVFISYSRADMAFADEIVAGLDYDAASRS